MFERVPRRSCITAGSASSRHCNRDSEGGRRSRHTGSVQARGENPSGTSQEISVFRAPARTEPGVLYSPLWEPVFQAVGLGSMGARDQWKISGSWGVSLGSRLLV